MKRYTFSVVIDEGSDEFWEELLIDNESGCDILRQQIDDTLSCNGIMASVTLTKYEDE